MSLTISQQVQNLQAHLPLNQVTLSDMVRFSQQMHRELQNSSADRASIETFNSSLKVIRQLVLIHDRLNHVERIAEQDSSSREEKWAASRKLMKMVLELPSSFRVAPRCEEIHRRMHFIGQRIDNPPSFLSRHKGKIFTALFAVGIARSCFDWSWTASLIAGSLIGILLPKPPRQMPPTTSFPPEPIPDPATTAIPPPTLPPALTPTRPPLETTQLGLLVQRETVSIPTTRTASYDQQWIDFYLGTGRDDYGRTLDWIFQHDDDWFESQHNFIQRLFLGASPGMYEDSPIHTPGIRAAFNTGPERARLQNGLRRCLKRMLDFYGFNYSEDCRTIRRSASFGTKPWIRADNRIHNHQRITRILTTLCDLGLRAEAEAFHAALTEAFQQRDYAPFIYRTTFSEHWTPAIRQRT